jgi:thiol-disulfide isomerase/thioredoxin
MMRSLMRAALAAAVMFVSREARAQDLGIELGKPAPAAAVQTLDGKAANLSAHIGKSPVLIEFWATWCPNCKELEPAMIALQKKYGAKVTFVNVAVAVNESPALVQRYVANHKLAGVQYYDTKNGDATGAYDVPATSYVVLIDKSGKVVYTGLGGKQDKDIEKAIQALK